MIEAPVESVYGKLLKVFQYARGDLTKRLHEAFQSIEGYCARHVKEKR